MSGGGAWKVADWNVRHLLLANGHWRTARIRETELGQPGARVNLECLANFGLDTGALPEGMDHLQAGGHLSARHHAVDRRDD